MDMNPFLVAGSNKFTVTQLNLKLKNDRKRLDKVRSDMMDALFGTMMTRTTAQAFDTETKKAMRVLCSNWFGCVPKEYWPSTPPYAFWLGRRIG